MQIHLSQPAGDILIFMTGQEDIISVCTSMTDRLSELGDQVQTPYVYAYDRTYIYECIGQVQTGHIYICLRMRAHRM